MGEKHMESSVNLANRCRGSKFHSRDLRISKSDGAIGKDIGRSVICVLPKYDILQESDLQGKHKAPDLSCSTKCSTRISCRAHVNQVKGDMGDSGNHFNVEEERYSLTPFHSFDNVCSRKRPFTLLDTDIVAPNRSNPRGSYVQDMPFIDKEIHLIGDSSSSSVRKNIGKYDNFQGHLAVISSRKQPSLPGSLSKESSAAHGSFQDYFDGPSAYGTLDASPTWNCTSNLIVKVQSCRDSNDKRIDEEHKMFNSDGVDCCCSSSVRANATETSCHLSNNSSNCLSSGKGKKDFSSNENSKRLKFAEKPESDHAMVDIDKEYREPILSSAISYNKREEPQSFERNSESTPFLNQNSLSTAEMGLSASRTTGTGKEDLTSRATIVEASNMNTHFHSTQNPSSRWVKRLKSHPMDSFVLGTRSFKMDNDASSGRVDKLYMRVLNYSRSNSNANVPFQKNLDQLKMKNPASSSSIQVESHVESLKKSHTWIRRLCRSSQNPCIPRMTQDNARALGQCGPENTKTIRNNLNRKLRPSVAAMALMGKAVSNFRPCEFRRRGPSVVWNTEGF